MCNVYCKSRACVWRMSMPLVYVYIYALLCDAQGMYVCRIGGNKIVPKWEKICGSELSNDVSEKFQ